MLNPSVKVWHVNLHFGHAVRILISWEDWLKNDATIWADMTESSRTWDTSDDKKSVLWFARRATSHLPPFPSALPSAPAHGGRSAARTWRGRGAAGAERGGAAGGRTRCPGNAGSGLPLVSQREGRRGERLSGARPSGRPPVLWAPGTPSRRVAERVPPLPGVSSPVPGFACSCFEARSFPSLKKELCTLIKKTSSGSVWLFLSAVTEPGVGNAYFEADEQSQGIYALLPGGAEVNLQTESADDDCGVCRGPVRAKLAGLC